MRDRLRKNRHDRGAGGAKLNEPGQEVVRGPDECRLVEIKQDPGSSAAATATAIRAATPTAPLAAALAVSLASLPELEVFELLGGRLDLVAVRG